MATMALVSKQFKKFFQQIYVDVLLEYSVCRGKLESIHTGLIILFGKNKQEAIILLKYGLLMHGLDLIATHQTKEITLLILLLENKDYLPLLNLINFIILLIILEN